MDNYTLNEHNTRLLVVEDDIELASLVQEFLSKNGYEVDVISNGLEAVDFILNEQPDLVLLDIMLPGMSGIDVCKTVRTQFNNPILMLTSLDEDMDQMLGLELGADDYVIKPVKPRLLLSRIKALLRRSVVNQTQLESMNTSRSTVTNGQSGSQSNALEIDLSKRSITYKGALISFTTAEYDLLKMLIDSAGEIISRDEVVQNLRGFEYDGLDRSIDRRISRLRKKLNDDSINPRVIKTIRGKGYLLCAPIKVIGNKLDD
ncbi:response regulator [Marinomonas mediterranea]|uniref:response regulator n=1 Tax=Marinomonas mediterranea TaxID=119864 RepID=UPI0023492A8B|nr:response regulator [Marinomonas mediterranea]WCN09574.1 response regulator [Marinomonas mediterranea]